MVLKARPLGVELEELDCLEFVMPENPMILTGLRSPPTHVVLDGALAFLPTFQQHSTLGKEESLLRRGGLNYGSRAGVRFQDER